MRTLLSSDGPASDSDSDGNGSFSASCGEEGLNESCGKGVDALVEAELVFEAGCEWDEEASAAVLVLAAMVIREEVVEGRTVAEVHDLVRRAVGREEGATLEARGVEVEARALSSAAASWSMLGIEGG